MLYQRVGVPSITICSKFLFYIISHRRFIQRCQPVNDHYIITNWNVIWRRRTVPLFIHGSASSDCKFKRWFMHKSFLNQMKNLLMTTNEMIKTLDRCPFNIEQTLNHQIVFIYDKDFILRWFFFYLTAVFSNVVVFCVVAVFLIAKI